jgi:hypothetical protein
LCQNFEAHPFRTPEENPELLDPEVNSPLELGAPAAKGIYQPSIRPWKLETA